MKRIISLLFITSFLACAVITTTPSAAATSTTVHTEQLQSYSLPQTSIQELPDPAELDPPNVDVSDLLNIPDNDAGATDWIFYVLSALLLLFYEVIAGKIKTKKSYKIFALLYRFSNWLIKDRAEGNQEEFTISKVKLK